MKEKTFTVRTSAREEIRIITAEVEQALRELTDGDGICTIITPHTTTAISVNENADPDVLTDLTKALQAMIPLRRASDVDVDRDVALLALPRR